MNYDPKQSLPWGLWKDGPNRENCWEEANVPSWTDLTKQLKTKLGHEGDLTLDNLMFFEGIPALSTFERKAAIKAMETLFKEESGITSASYNLASRQWELYSDTEQLELSKYHRIHLEVGAQICVNQGAPKSHQAP